MFAMFVIDEKNKKKRIKIKCLMLIEIPTNITKRDEKYDKRKKFKK